MEHFIVDMQTEKSKKYYFIREEVSQEIVLLPSQYLMHKMRAMSTRKSHTMKLAMHISRKCFDCIILLNSRKGASKV